ncbi:hypothetical protein [Sutcliffiella horikoshii]|uniref:Uncharacterized protein n=1 Tax=Sutcliffiella horikoshii TaxID=79883 RepID=A0A5D4T693_9BACI|nr:hypothetical protein [Sutcliffiella horikoshii]TYS71123.1 hypothetical protein FZC75_13885 [Sutcliffiella horikoshii]
MTTTTADSKRKERTFTRAEMVDFAKKKLLKSNSEIEFVGLKHNILTCKINDKTFKVYISSSRDFEFMRKPPEHNPYRVSAWNKGSSNIFSSCDYYALLVKVDENTKYTTDSDEKIEGLFVSQNELNNWLSKKVNVPSGMINFYVHYSQVPGEGRMSIKVVDDREDPYLSLDYLYELGWKIR